MMLAILMQSFLAGQIPVTANADFPAATQKAAIVATARLQVGLKTGSGVVVGKSGPFLYILTAAHVVDDKQAVRVALFSGESYPKPAHIYESGAVIAYSLAKDLAIVRLSTSDVAPGMLPLGAAKKTALKADSPVLTCGCVEGRAPTCKSDSILKRALARRTESDAPVLFWQTAERYDTGYSGGALVDGAGEVAGICSGISKDSGYFVHIFEIHAFLRQEGLSWLADGK